MRSLLVLAAVLFFGVSDAHASDHSDHIIDHGDGTITVVHTTRVSKAGVRKPTRCVKRRGKVIRCTRPGHVCKKVKVKAGKKRGKTVYRRVWQCRKKVATTKKKTPAPKRPAPTPPAPASPPAVVPPSLPPAPPSTPPASPAPPAPPVPTGPAVPPDPSVPTPVGSNVDGACSPSHATDFSFNAAYKPAWKHPLPWFYNPANQPAVAHAGDPRGLFGNILAGWTHQTACGVDPAAQSVLGTPGLLATAYAGDTQDVGYRDQALVVRYADNATTVCGDVAAVGCTFTRFYVNGPMISADLVMRTDAAMRETGVRWSTSDTPGPWDLDFQATLMHEAGHALGLSHTSENSGQTMSPVIQAGAAGLASRSPGAGDLAGRDVLYQ